MNATRYDILDVGRFFRINGNFLEAEPCGNGHINDTYAAVYDVNGSKVRYIHQRINTDIFKKPFELMNNVVRVTEHQRKKLNNSQYDDAERRALTLIPAIDGKYFHENSDGIWRTYKFIEGAQTREVVESAGQAFEVARMFGDFQRQLVDLPGRLAETIPDFHNTPKRFEALEKAIDADAVNRAANAQNEIEFAVRHKEMTNVLIDMQKKGLIQERVTHNDTKLNNVMLDIKTGDGVCIIDLDTVMPGLVLYDFGDMVRTATSFSEEDEKDLSKVWMQISVFEALARGYISSAGEFLTDIEKQYLPFSGKLITFETGIRFLTDFLSGDIYFRIHRPEHNLDRCRTQFKLVASIEEQEEQMNKIVSTASQTDGR
ncbi:MAG: aminoglycoside phosphotransferase family protein [Lentisphaerae bacterium]|nr:aminoglycoside phosphotransferase family protein [Lentisphaerota bacterium]